MVTRLVHQPASAVRQQYDLCTVLQVVLLLLGETGPPFWNVQPLHHSYLYQERTALFLETSTFRFAGKEIVALDRKLLFTISPSGEECQISRTL